MPNRNQNSASGKVSLNDVIINDQVQHRPARMRDKDETEALIALSRAIATSPSSTLQLLAECALNICNAGSSGVSILQKQPDGEVPFRWKATAGKLSKYLGGTMPRSASPCGVVIDRNDFQLMSNPVRYFPEIAKLDVPIFEALLAPFYHRNQAVGTLWVVSHTPDKKFYSEDIRLVMRLCKFASGATDTLHSVNAF
jgi:hypothetical protein